MAIKRTKLINTSRIMREIWTNREISRVQVARNLGLDKSTVSAIVTDLLDLGVIRETTEGPVGRKGGRRPVNITLDSGFGCVLGAELRPESYTVVGVDLTGEVVFSKFERLPTRGDALRESLLAVLDRAESEVSACGLPILGLGVGLSGIVDPEEGVVKYSIPLKRQEPFNFYEAMAADLDVPFLIENDANACAWGELAFHRHRDLRDFLFVLIELRDIAQPEIVHEKTAVGFGVVIDGKVHRGYRNSAGEFRSVLRGPEHAGQFSLSREESARIDHDPEVMERFIRELAGHVALFTNTFDLSHVFLGGSIDWRRHRVQEVIYEEIQRNWPYPDEVPCRIDFSSLGDRAVAYGAAGMVLERMFADLETMRGLAALQDERGPLLHGWPVTAEAASRGEDAREGDVAVEPRPEERG